MHEVSHCDAQPFTSRAAYLSKFICETELDTSRQCINPAGLMETSLIGLTFVKITVT